MSDLGTALRELARGAEASADVDAHGLWRDGRRRVRSRRLLAASAAAVLVLLVVAVGAAGPEPRLISPAQAPRSPGIPHRVQDPPGWLPVTPYGNRAGPLSVLGVGLRHGTERLFGIEAATGRYRFLAVDDRVPGTPLALSPDGRRVAYWAGKGGVVTRMTTFDTVKGTASHVDRGSTTSLGLQPGPLTWLDDDTVLLESGQRRKQGASIVVPEDSRQTATYQPDGGGTVVRIVDPNSGAWSHARDGHLLVPLSRPDRGSGAPVTFVGYDRTVSAVGTEFELPPGGYGSVSRSGDTVVAAGYTGARGQVGLLTGTVPPLGGVTPLHEVGDLRVGTLLGWHSDHSVLVTGWRHVQKGPAGLFEADLATGTVRRVGDAGSDVDVMAAVASNLLEKPLVTVDPPHGLDPGLVRSGALGVLALALVAVVWRRRRGRA